MPPVWTAVGRISASFAHDLRVRWDAKMRGTQLRTPVLESDATVEIVLSETEAFFRSALLPAAPPCRWNLSVANALSFVFGAVGVCSLVLIFSSYASAIASQHCSTASVKERRGNC